MFVPFHLPYHDCICVYTNVLISGLKLTSPVNVGQKKLVSILKGEYVFNFNLEVKT